MILDLLFPVKCLQCGKSGKYICTNCLGKVGKAKQICVECERSAIDGMVHIKCKTPWGLDGCTAIWNYSGVVRKALIKLKYKFAYEIAGELAGNAARFLKTEVTALPKDCLLTVVPLHKKRERWRGFNQIEEIGKLVCKKMNWKFVPNILIRKKHVQPQVELKGKERRSNVLGVFEFNSSFKSLVYSHQSLVIFDDVLTTGATIREASKVLKRNSAKTVWGLTIAK